ncbi:MAG: hypothetical protein U0821_14220 [Chloroflexota bacterium]
MARLATRALGLAILILAAGLIAPTHAQPDPRLFEATGFRVDDDVIWDFFQRRGGTRTFGNAISRTATLGGVPTQLFERFVVQRLGDRATVLNALDAGWLDTSDLLGEPLPPVDPALVRLAPNAASPDYGSALKDLVDRAVPNELDGLPVRFRDAFANTVTEADAFPTGGANTALLPLFNVEVWGLPTSAPLRDGATPERVYLRFQHGLLRFTAACRCTETVPVGARLKAVLTGEVPAPGSRLASQYDRTAHVGPRDPALLPDSDLANAFRPSTESAPVAVATSEPSARPAPAVPEGPNPRDIILTQDEVGVDGKPVLSDAGKDPRGSWIRRRWERKRETLAVNTGPTVADNTIWIANDVESAHAIFAEEAARDDFPEAGDKREGSFPFKIDKLGDEISAMSACEKCSDQRLNLHHRIVARKGRVVSVMYLFGRDNVIDQKMATWFVAQVLLRI